MARPPHPTPEVARARRYAARVRILLAVVGGGLLAVDPAVTSHPVPAAIGFAVIGVTGVVEWAVQNERWLAVEETLSCVAVVCMVGFNAGEREPRQHALARGRRKRRARPRRAGRRRRPRDRGRDAALPARHPGRDERRGDRLRAPRRSRCCWPPAGSRARPPSCSTAPGTTPPTTRSPACCRARRSAPRSTA